MKEKEEDGREKITAERGKKEGEKQRLDKGN